MSTTRPNSQSGRTPDETSRTVPIVEEHLHVAKREVVTGRVTLTKQVHAEDVSFEVPVRRDTVSVERVPVDEFVEKAPETRYEGDVLVVPVVKEVIVKRLLLVEEVRISPRSEQHVEKLDETLRREEVRVTRDEASPQ